MTLQLGSKKTIYKVAYGEKHTPYDFSWTKYTPSLRDGFFRVTADCPLLDYRLFDSVLDKLNEGHGRVATHHDLVNDGLSRQTENAYPDGWDIEGFDKRVLKHLAYQLNISSALGMVDKPEMKVLVGLSTSVNYWHDLQWVRKICSQVQDPTCFKHVAEWFNWYSSRENNQHQRL